MFFAYFIPANFFWDRGVRFLSWECWDFWRRHDQLRRFPKKSKVYRRSPKSSKDVWSPSPSLRTRINASSLPVLFTSKIRDCEEGIVIYSLYTWFSFLTSVWVDIFFEIVPSKTATTHISKSGVRNWPAGVSRYEDRSFQPAGVRLTPKAWEIAGILFFEATWPPKGLLLRKETRQKRQFPSEHQWKDRQGEVSSQNLTTHQVQENGPPKKSRFSCNIFASLGKKLGQTNGLIWRTRHFGMPVPNFCQQYMQLLEDRFVHKISVNKLFL